MSKRLAPRLLSRIWARLTRGALLTAVLWHGGQVARAEEIISAQFAGPTDRYGHAILGDAIEFSELIVETQVPNGTRRYRATLPPTHVFEDLAPRLWDVTGDGSPEVVVIETDMNLGGSLAIYDHTGKIAETAHIGRTNRWLAPVAAGDMDGDGRIEIAFVDRPHLAKVLRIFEFDGAALQLEAEVAGLTNHRIGEDFITGGLRSCPDGLGFVTADHGWSRVIITSFDGAGYTTKDAGAFSPERVRQVLDCG